MVGGTPVINAVSAKRSSPVALFFMGIDAPVIVSAPHLNISPVTTHSDYNYMSDAASLTSTSFANNSPIPLTNICQEQGGQNVSPDLKWHFSVPGIQCYLLLCIDIDANEGQGNAPPQWVIDKGWIHWFLLIPSTITELPAGGSHFRDITPYHNSWGERGYKGPCPPSGKTHHYLFKVFALDNTILNSASVLQSASLMGVYENIDVTPKRNSGH